ncbi:hypothetical protein MXD81_10890, partial [Microbacteriaceae bacterium K1510]|nr:hypothetical protein [Microbacteriaceae bacterium K1510]
EFSLAPRLKLTTDVAYIPYVKLRAVDHHYGGNSGVISSTNPLDGQGVGTQLEAMLSYDLTDNWSIGVGGRYWAMWTPDGIVDFGNEELVPMRYSVEQASLLFQGSYTFSDTTD